MADHPDVYADGFSITAGPFGVTLTLTKTEPTGEPGPHEEPSVIVARVRCSQALGAAMADALAQMLAAAAQAGAAPQRTTIRH
jgi:hypothetical protein